MLVAGRRGDFDELDDLDGAPLAQVKIVEVGLGGLCGEAWAGEHDEGGGGVVVVHVKEEGAGHGGTGIDEGKGLGISRIVHSGYSHASCGCQGRGYSGGSPGWFENQAKIPSRSGDMQTIFIFGLSQRP